MQSFFQVFYYLAPSTHAFKAGIVESEKRWGSDCRAAVMKHARWATLRDSVLDSTYAHMHVS